MSISKSPRFVDCSGTPKPPEVDEAFVNRKAHGLWLLSGAECGEELLRDGLIDVLREAGVKINEGTKT